MSTNQQDDAGPVITKLMLAPRVGMMSLVGIGPSDYPIKFGNYCSIWDGPYLVNMWAENLKEWARRNPDSGPIEITEYTHGERSLGVVTDERLKDWCNVKPCVTGYGWPSVAVLRLLGEVMGFPVVNEFCGCERETESPRISESWRTGPVREHTFICHRCKRRWQAEEQATPPGGAV